MFKNNYLEKYKILYNPLIEEGTLFDLGSTSGEILISDGATLDCKEQLGYSNKL